MKIDFHVHTNASSDSLIKADELMKKSKIIKIIPAITDHDTVKGWEKMEKGSFIPGIEIRTKQGDIIGLFVNEEIPKKLDFEETAEKIKEQGGLVYLPHMYDITRKGCGSAYAKLADIIEVFNGRCIEQFNKMAEKTATELKKPKAAGSDSHFLFEFGGTYVELEDFDLESPKEMIKALKNKSVKIIGTKAPFFIRGPTWILSKARKLWKAVNKYG